MGPREARIRHNVVQIVALRAVPWPVLSGPATMPRSQPRVEAMKKPSRAGRKPAKARPRKALKRKGRNAPKTLSNRRSPADNSESEVARLKRELREALEQQTATSEVLQVISSSLGELQPGFASMLEKAVHICDAKFGYIYRCDGNAFDLVATYNVRRWNLGFLAWNKSRTARISSLEVVGGRGFSAAIKPVAVAGVWCSRKN
jgi:hypothetical protein